MKFEWDAIKNESNKTKHGIAFETAKELWKDGNRVEIHVPYPNEERFIIIGKLINKHWTAVYTKRGDKVRIISVRRSMDKEVELYEKDS